MTFVLYHSFFFYVFLVVVALLLLFVDVTIVVAVIAVSVLQQQCQICIDDAFVLFVGGATFKYSNTTDTATTLMLTRKQRIHIKKNVKM